MVTLLAATMPLLVVAPAQAGSNMEKVDIVAEGIDLKPLYVGANANGYTGTENTPHNFMVRVFAKAKGQNRVWAVSIYGYGTGHKMFEKEVGKSEGWEVYGKSHVVSARPRDLQWLTVPVQLCKDNMAKLMASGMTKAQVLDNDRKVMAHAQIAFSAWADSKAHNKKNDHRTADGFREHSDNIVYPVPVVCRAAL